MSPETGDVFVPVPATRRFHLGDLITMTDGHLVAPGHMQAVRDVVTFITGEQHQTHQLPRAFDVVKPWLLGQHRWLADITCPDGMDADAVEAWLAQQVARYGEWHDVTAMPFGTYVGRDPIAELVEMVGPDRVIAVELPRGDLS